MTVANGKIGSVESRSRYTINACVDTVRQWTRGFRPDAEVLQIGFEGGAIPQSLIDAGLCLHLVEASRMRLRIFRQMFAEVPSACSEAAACALFSRTFDGVLLCASARTMPKASGFVQLARIERLLRAGGRLLIIIAPQTQAPVDLRGEPGGTSSAEDVCEKILCNSGLDILPRLLDFSGYEYVCAVKHVQAGVPH